MSLRLDHIGLTVSDLERSARFYSELLGQAPYFQELYDVDYIGGIVGLPGAVQYAAFFHIPGQESTFLELIEYRSPRGKDFANGPNDVGTAHLCLECDDLDAEWERLVGLGAASVSARPSVVTTGCTKAAIRLLQGSRRDLPPGSRTERAPCPGGGKRWWWTLREVGRRSCPASCRVICYMRRGARCVEQRRNDSCLRRWGP